MKVVPVAVSYEFDPNDINKAIECAKTNQGLEYIKSSDEDIRSIAKGIADIKGDVSINIGSPIEFLSDDADEIADLITRAIRRLYYPHATNYAALMKSQDKILDHRFSNKQLECAMNYLEKRSSSLTQLEKAELLSQYYQCLVN